MAASSTRAAAATATRRPDGNTQKSSPLHDSAAAIGAAGEPSTHTLVRCVSTTAAPAVDAWVTRPPVAARSAHRALAGISKTAMHKSSRGEQSIAAAAFAAAAAAFSSWGGGCVTVRRDTAAATVDRVAASEAPKAAATEAAAAVVRGGGSFTRIAAAVAPKSAWTVLMVVSWGVGEEGGEWETTCKLREGVAKRGPRRRAEARRRGHRGADGDATVIGGGGSRYGGDANDMGDGGENAVVVMHDGSCRRDGGGTAAHGGKGGGSGRPTWEGAASPAAATAAAVDGRAPVACIDGRCGREGTRCSVDGSVAWGCSVGGDGGGRKDGGDSGSCSDGGDGGGCKDSSGGGDCRGSGDDGGVGGGNSCGSGCTSNSSHDRSSREIFSSVAPPPGMAIAAAGLGTAMATVHPATGGATAGAADPVAWRWRWDGGATDSPRARRPADCRRVATAAVAPSWGGGHDCDGRGGDTSDGSGRSGGVACRGVDGGGGGGGGSGSGRGGGGDYSSRGSECTDRRRPTLRSAAVTAAPAGDAPKDRGDGSAGVDAPAGGGPSPPVRSHAARSPSAAGDGGTDDWGGAVPPGATHPPTTRSGGRHP